MLLSLDAHCNTPFEIGAMLDVVLCFPNFPPERQLKIANAICANLVSGWIRKEPERARELRPMLREYRKIAQRASFGTLEKRRRQALIAGQSFLPLIKESASGQLPIIDGVGAKLSRHQIASYIWPARENGKEINYESRLRDRRENDIWPWYPVAHLAAAYQGLARLGAGSSDGCEFDYQNLDFHMQAVILAGEFARHFRGTPRLADIAAQLLDIELVLPG